MGDSFKSGSGNLNFGDSRENEQEAEETGAKPEEADDLTNETTDSQEPKQTSSDKEDARKEVAGTNDDADGTTEGDHTATSTASGSEAGQTGGHKYPYFVRRSNVGDERDNRLELFARDDVAARESEFRNRLASELGTNDVAKTDAREYALLAAFDNVEDVAELMKEDGYGELD